MSSIDRRAFIANGTLLALAAYAGRAGAQDAPRSSFAAGATAEEVTAGIDLSGKTIVVTGCNSGIGLETMRVLALRGAHVIGTARTPERGQEACAGVKGKATPVVLELSDFDSVVACANAIRAMNTPIDALVCNAGLLLTDLQQARGLELQFVVNHLGHFILVNRLLERVTAAPQGRVVVVGSVAHQFVPPGGIQFDNLSGKGWERQAYGHSKLANGLFSLELVEAPRRHARDVELAASRRRRDEHHAQHEFAARAAAIAAAVAVSAEWKRRRRARPRAAISRAIRRSRASRACTSPTAIRPSRATTRRTPPWPRSCGRSPPS